MKVKCKFFDVKVVVDFGVLLELNVKVLKVILLL